MKIQEEKGFYNEQYLTKKFISFFNNLKPFEYYINEWEKQTIDNELLKAKPYRVINVFDVIAKDEISIGVFVKVYFYKTKSFEIYEKDDWLCISPHGKYSCSHLRILTNIDIETLCKNKECYRYYFVEKDNKTFPAVIIPYKKNRNIYQVLVFLANDAALSYYVRMDSTYYIFQKSTEIEYINIFKYPLKYIKYSLTVALKKIEEELSRGNLDVKVTFKIYETNESIKNIAEKFEKTFERVLALLKGYGRDRYEFGDIIFDKFMGDDYLPFIRKELGNIIIYYEPFLFNLYINKDILEYMNIQDIIYDLPTTIEENLNAANQLYLKLMNIEKPKKEKIHIYLFSERSVYHRAFKNWKNFRYGSEHSFKRDSRIEVFVSPSPFKEYYTTRDMDVIVHEYIHALDTLYGFNSLSLIEEGLATYIPTKLKLREERKFPEYMNFEYALKLRYECKKGSRTNEMCQRDYSNTYNYAYWFVKFLIERYGVEKFSELYKTLTYEDYKIGMFQIDKKFRHVYGKGVKELEKEFKEYIKSQLGKVSK